MVGSVLWCLNQHRLESAIRIQKKQKLRRRIIKEGGSLAIGWHQWVELFVRDMMNASDIKDPKGRAAISF